MIGQVEIDNMDLLDFDHRKRSRNIVYRNNPSSCCASKGEGGGGRGQLEEL